MRKETVLFTITIAIICTTLQIFGDEKFPMRAHVASFVILVAAIVLFAIWGKKQKEHRTFTVPECILLGLWVLLFPDLVSMAFSNVFIKYGVIGLGTLVFVFLLETAVDLAREEG